LYNKEGEKINHTKKLSFLSLLFTRQYQSRPTNDKNCSKKIFSFIPTNDLLNQIEIIKTVDDFLAKNKMRVNTLQGPIEYDWEGRGMYPCFHDY